MVKKVSGNILQGEPPFIEIKTASDHAKAAGLKNLLQVAELTGQSTQTLNNWFNKKPDLFDVVIAGCVAKITIKRM